MNISSIFPDFYFAYSWCILIAMLVLPFHKDKKQVLQFVVWCNLWVALLSLMNGFAWYETMVESQEVRLFWQSFDNWAAINHFLTFDNALIIAPMQLFWIRAIRTNLLASCLIAMHLQMHLLVVAVNYTAIIFEERIVTIIYEDLGTVTSFNPRLFRPDFIPIGWSGSSHYYINILSNALGIGIFTLLLFFTYKVFRDHLPTKLKKILEL